MNQSKLKANIILVADTKHGKTRAREVLIGGQIGPRFFLKRAIAKEKQIRMTFDTQVETALAE